MILVKRFAQDWRKRGQQLIWIILRAVCLHYEFGNQPKGTPQVQPTNPQDKITDDIFVVKACMKQGKDCSY